MRILIKWIIIIISSMVLVGIMKGFYKGETIDSIRYNSIQVAREILIERDVV